ncbi:potassium transporter TrkA [Mycolicibacterium chubuense]|uniref:Voltage-gated potassium channel Kch n=1 Tax=Mycolicibacterium chubuense TaxID=1800 RepID=A0A0J6WC70_MYCCU|nr:NAD-binding protein [Mycolicibacterium chubuense]KMO80144.1 Voltage-gated potassium channel Kch [Mycolicibacterium chubuense]ORA43538.1 potassium transporter TrkA [Mycolicibacterium chubuense]SPY45473.1 K+ transport system, NAD-binding component [Mycolicibacterium chubuense]
MVGHTIVSGADALAVRIAEELRSAGATVTVIDRADQLTSAGIATAASVVCAGSDDAANLEIALLARRLSSTVRVVTRLANGVLREAMVARNGPGAVLDVADLAAPSVVEACLQRTTHSIAAGDLRFVVSGADTPRSGTLRDIYGDLAPVAVVRGVHSPTPGEVAACPGRDLHVDEGDWVAMIGTEDELAADGPVAGARAAGSHRSPLTRIGNAARAFHEDVNPNFYRALAASLGLLLGSTILLWLTYDMPGMSFVDALYFSTETIATVGYGDFSFSGQPTWLRLFSIVLMFAGITTTAVLVAFVADLLLSRRLAYSAGRRKVRELQDHMIVVGLGSFGVRVASDLKAAGHDVAVIELNDENRYLSAAADLEIPVIFGDATLPSTLEAARIDDAVAVAVLTDDDMVNIETAIVSRERSKDRPLDVPVVLRVFDRALGAAVAHRFRFENVLSTVELAAPWFIGAALGLTVFGTFSVGQASFMVGGVRVGASSELDGIRMAELSTQTRVIAIVGHDGARELHPRRDSQLHAGDIAYLVGPYRELLDTLRKGQGSSAATAIT